MNTKSNNHRKMQNYLGPQASCSGYYPFWKKQHKAASNRNSRREGSDMLRLYMNDPVVKVGDLWQENDTWQEVFGFGVAGGSALDFPDSFDSHMDYTDFGDLQYIRHDPLPPAAVQGEYEARESSDTPDGKVWMVYRGYDMVADIILDRGNFRWVVDYCAMWGNRNQFAFDYMEMGLEQALALVATLNRLDRGNTPSDEFSDTPF